MDKNVMMILCAALGVVCWGIAAVCAIGHRKDVSAVIRFAGLGVFSSMFFFVLPYGAEQSGLLAVPFTMLQVMASAVVASDPLAIFEAVSQAYPMAYPALYKAALLILHVISPLFTIGITLSFFENSFSEAVYRLRANYRPSHIFSDINERTLSLAESIYASNKKALFVFNGDSQKLEERRDFSERIHEIGGTVLDMAPGEVRHSLRHTRTYYLLGMDSGRNLKDAIRLFEKYDKQGGEMVKLWLYSKDELAAIIFDNLDERIDLRLVNEEQLISMGLMRKYPLYNAVSDGKLEIMLVGAGKIGVEILKAAMWCAQLGDGVEVSFHVLDLAAARAAEKLERDCPGLAESCHVTFHTVDIETDSFHRALAQAKPDYIVLALGEEQRNLRAGTQIRRFYGSHPQIHVLTDHRDTETMILENLLISDWRFERAQRTFRKKELCSFELLPFGSYAETYSNVRFSNGYYDFLAMAIHAVRFGITETDATHDAEYLRDLLNKVEFYKNYSYAYATAVPYKLWLMGLELADDGERDLSALEAALPQYEKLLVDQENARWNCYMRTHGWQPMPLEQVQGNVYQDKMRRLHARLDSQNVQKLGAMVGRDFEKEDVDNLYRLPAMLRLANSLSGRNYSVRSITKK